MKHQWGLFFAGLLLALLIFGGIFIGVAIKNRNQQIEELQQEISALEEKLDQQEALIEKLQQPTEPAEPEEAPEKEPETTPEQEPEQEEEQPQEPKPEQVVAGATHQYFLTEFDDYAPDSNATLISVEKAKQIAQKGFEESAKRISAEGTENLESQKMEMKQICANNYFTRKGMEYDKKYTHIFRTCYIFTRTNEMGCGVSVYVDATTGLIIGGTAFGD